MRGTTMGAIGFSYDQESLFTGLSILLRGISFPSQAEETISSSFESTAKGLGVARGGLFLVRHHPDSTRLEALCHCGMSPQQVRAVECGSDSENAATSRIWKILSQWCTQGAFSPKIQPIERIAPNLCVLCIPIVD